jgi:hypothetical protein
MGPSKQLSKIRVAHAESSTYSSLQPGHTDKHPGPVNLIAPQPFIQSKLIILLYLDHRDVGIRWRRIVIVAAQRSGLRILPA